MLGDFGTFCETVASGPAGLGPKTKVKAKVVLWDLLQKIVALTIARGVMQASRKHFGPSPGRMSLSSAWIAACGCSTLTAKQHD